MDFQSNLGATGELLKNAFRGLSDEMQMCIQNCMVCHQICSQMITYSLEKGGAHAAPEHIKTLIDCAEICATSANFMVRKSDLHSSTCRACADACIACAENCERMSGEDEIMKSCAEICRRCAESCQKMAAKH